MNGYLINFYEKFLFNRSINLFYLFFFLHTSFSHLHLDFFVSSDYLLPLSFVFICCLIFAPLFIPGFILRCFFFVPLAFLLLWRLFRFLSPLFIPNHLSISVFFFCWDILPVFFFCGDGRGGVGSV